MKNVAALIITVTVLVHNPAEAAGSRLVPTQSGDFRLLSPAGWVASQGQSQNGSVVIKLTSPTDAGVAIALSSKLGNTTGSTSAMVSAMLQSAKAGLPRVLRDNKSGTTVEADFESSDGRRLFTWITCVERPEEGGYRHTCAMAIATSIAAISRAFTANDLLKITASVQAGRALIGAPVAPSAPLIGTWQSSEGFPGYTEYMHDGSVRNGGAGEFVHLELGAGQTYRFVSFFSTSGPYFPGVSVLDDSGTYSKSGDTYVFQRKRCSRNGQIGQKPPKKEACHNQEGPSKVELTIIGGGQQIEIVGMHLRFMPSDNPNRWQLTRVR